MLQKHSISFLDEDGNWCLFTKILCLYPTFVPIFPMTFFRLFNNSGGNLTCCGVPNQSCLDDLFVNQARNAVFFARRASLTSWFHQAVLFSLLI